MPSAQDECTQQSESFSLYGRQPQVRRSHARQIKLGPYLLLQTLGEGEFGKVKLGIHTETGQEFAIKLIRKETVGLSASRMSKVEREIRALRTLKHPHIVKLFDVVETERHIGIILEYASGGELFEHILARRALEEKDARRLFAQLISSVQYMHRKNIVHRDLKLENLLLDRRRNIVVTDFGFANYFNAGNDLMATSCGSPCYAAPELVVSDGLYQGPSVDVWSCGVILYAMLCGYLPFEDDPCNPDGNNINQLYRYILCTSPSFPAHVSPDARDLMRRMLTADPTRRCSLDAVQQHPWLHPHAALFAKPDPVVENEAAVLAEQAFIPTYRSVAWSSQQHHAAEKVRPATVHGLCPLTQYRHGNGDNTLRIPKTQTARPPARRERLLSFFTNNASDNKGANATLAAPSKLRSKLMASLRGASTTTQRPPHSLAAAAPQTGGSDKDEAVVLHCNESLEALTRNNRRSHYYSTVGAASGRAIAAMRNSLLARRRDTTAAGNEHPSPLPSPPAVPASTTAGSRVVAWIRRKSGGSKAGSTHHRRHQSTTATATATHHEPPKPEKPVASRTATDLHSTAYVQPTTHQHQHQAQATPSSPEKDAELEPMDKQCPRVHHGAVDRSALTSRPPGQMMDEIRQTLTALGIAHMVDDRPYKLKCTRRKARTPPDNVVLFPDPGRLSATSSCEHSLLSTETEEEAAAIAHQEEHLSPVYGDPITDTGDEVRFVVEISRFRNLPGLYMVDVRRLRGSIWAYKFLYHKLLDLLHLGSYCYTTTTASFCTHANHLVRTSSFSCNCSPAPIVEGSRSSSAIAPATY